MSHRNTVKRKNCFLYAHPFTGKNDSFRNYLISHFLSFPPLSKSQNRTLSLAPGKLRYCQSQWCFTFGRHPVDTKDVNYGGREGLLWFGDLKGPYYFIIISTGAIDDDVGQILEPLLVGINLVNVMVWHEQCLARNCIVWHLHFSLSKLLIVDITITLYEMNKMALGIN